MLARTFESCYTFDPLFFHTSIVRPSVPPYREMRRSLYNCMVPVLGTQTGPFRGVGRQTMDRVLYTGLLTTQFFIVQ